MSVARTYRITNSERVFQGHFAVDRLTIDHSTARGKDMTGVVREVFNRGSAVAIVLYDPAVEKMVWVEQFRAGLALAGDPLPWAIEPVAGTLEGPDDDPLSRILEECQEEIGAKPHKVYPISGFYPSPGACSEYIHMFVGLIDSTTVAQVGGLAEHNEDILVQVWDFDKSVDALRRGRLSSGPAVAGMLWLMANRAFYQEEARQWADAYREADKYAAFDRGETDVEPT